MKAFKVVDFWFQAILITVCLVLALTKALDFYNVCLIVSCTQFVSMLVHEAAHLFVSSGAPRRKYHNAVYIIVACMIPSIWLKPFLYIFLPLFFLAPFMAAYYLRLCYKETYVYLKRPLSILK
jgi:hypothetical protein